MSRTIDRVVRLIAERFPRQDLCPAPCVVLASPAQSSAGLSFGDLFDGWLWATPKHRTPARQKWREKYGASNWQYGQKLYKSMNNIMTCPDCGSFHQFHTICRKCFQRVQEESKEVIASIRKAWGHGIIDKEVQVIYEGEVAPKTPKRIVELERPRPLWFESNLSQLAAHPKTEIAGTATESVDRVVRVKENKQDTPS